VKPFDRVQSWHLVVILGLAAACGSSAMGGGIAGTSAVVGSISGFGSVIVNGIEFDTSSATVTIDGSPAAVSDLELGMVATVRGSVDPGGLRGVAQSVISDDLLEGPLETVDLPTMTFTVLSQQVVADAATVFDPMPLQSLPPGEFVQVSGFLDATGRIRATRVERKLPDVEIEVKGYIQQLDATARSFKINALTVDFAAALIEGAPPGGLQIGLFVDVESAGPPTGGVMTAIGVDVLDPSLKTEPGDGLKVEGFITAIVSATEVVVNGSQRVRTTSDTRFERGGPGDLVLDAQVDVTGAADADGALVATEVEFLGAGLP